MSNTAVSKSMNMIDAVRLARDLGVEYEILNRTGEYAFRKPDGGTLRINSRRKDSPRALITLLRQAERAGQAS